MKVVFGPGSGFGKDRDLALAGIPFDLSVFQGEEGVVVADADILAGVEAGPALADENRPGLYGLAILALDAESLAVAVTPVLTGSLTFLVCHDAEMG